MNPILFRVTVLAVSLIFFLSGPFSARAADEQPALTGPSRTITQEMGSVIKDSEVNVDLTVMDGTLFYYQPNNQYGNPYPLGAPQRYIPTVQINMGIWGGELRVGGGYGTEATSTTGSIGYKMMVGPGAAYGRLNFNQISPSSEPNSGQQPKTGDFDITGGYAFTRDLKSMIVNFSGEFTIDSNSTNNGTSSSNQATTDFKLNGAVLIPLISKLSFVGELGFDTSTNPGKVSNGASSTAIDIGLGGRLTPNNKVTVDAMVLNYASLTGGQRPYDSITGVGTPFLFRANYQF